MLKITKIRPHQKGSTYIFVKEIASAKIKAPEHKVKKAIKFCC